MTVSDELVEATAQAIFEHWQFQQSASATIEWVRDGNSLKQEEARAYARAAIEAASPAIRAETAAAERERCAKRVVMEDPYYPGRWRCEINSGWSYPSKEAALEDAIRALG